MHKCPELGHETPKTQIKGKERTRRHRKLKDIKKAAKDNSPQSKASIIKSLLDSPDQRTQHILVKEKYMLTKEDQKEQIVNEAVLCCCQGLHGSNVRNEDQEK